jgi:2-iminobutanoate/2-iminopropanoate deaminase
MRTIQTDHAPAAIGPYSQAVSAGPFVFVSGQIGLEPGAGELVSPDFGPQARQALQNLKAIVEAGGHALSDVASVDVFLTHIQRFQEFNALYEAVFADHRPARAVIEVSGLPKGAQVEVRCIVFDQSR